MWWPSLSLPHRRELPPNERSSMKRTIDLLQGLKHDHVLGVRRYWDASRAGPKERQSRSLPWQSGETSAGEGERVVFLTTPCTTLEAFVDTKVEFLRWRVVKRWSRQILEALLFLHDQSPPVVHNTIYIDPSKSHLFVGGVCDIVAPPPVTRSKGRLSSNGSGGGGGGGGGPRSWGNKAWGLVSGGGMSCGLDSADNDRHVGKEGGEPSAAPEGEEEVVEEEEEEEEDGTARDVRAFGTVLIEMILKRRLDPALAEDERFLEMLFVFSGWPESVVDLLRSCRAPINERPSAEQLLRHPFLELGNDLDDEAVYGDPTLVAGAFAAVHGHEGFAHQPTPGASSLPVPLCPAGNGSGGGGTTCSNTPTSSTDCPAWSSSSCGGGGGGVGGGYGHHTPSCVSTESPSPSSPSAAPSFGGVPTVPSPATAAMSAAAVGPFASPGGFGPYLDAAAAAAGGGGYGFDRGEDFSSLLPAGVTLAAYENVQAIAARMQQAAHPYSGPGAAAPFHHHPTNGYDDDGRGERVGRNRSASAGGMPGGGSRSEDAGIGGYGFGLSQREEGGLGEGGGGVASTGRPRSASEDAVWDMLPSDESQCRRPFSVSAVEGRHGY
ncbi:unnamed protein product [Ectocarpus fasciculatus]